MKNLLLLFVIGLASAAPGPQDCSSQTINVAGQWSMPQTVLSANQDCDLSFIIPADSYALVDVQSTNVDYYDAIYITDNLGDSVSKFSSNFKYNTFSSSLAWPGSFSINLQTQQVAGMQVQITVTLKKATPKAISAGQYTTGANKPSTLLYFNDLIEGSSYTFTSQTKLNLKSAILANEDSTQYNNIFVYDGGNLIGTFMSVNDRHVFNTNQVTLYVAKKVSIKGAILATDAANVAKLESHYVTYAPIDQQTRMQTHLIKGDQSLEGALTIIGDKDGSTPINVLRVSTLDNLNGRFSYTTGGPLTSHPQASPLYAALFPLKINSNLMTFYLSQGRGTIEYSTPF